MKRTLFTFALALQVGAASAEWYDEDGYAGGTVGTDNVGYSSMATSGNDDFLMDFGESSGVDPVYSTPDATTSSFGYAKQRAFVPNNIYFEFFSDMGLRHNTQHVRMFNVYFSTPLTSTERTTWNGWHFDASASMRATWLKGSGNHVLDESRLYTMGFQASVGHMLGQNAYAQVGFVPQFSSDFDVMSHQNFYWGGYFAVSARPSDNFRFTMGFAYMPDYYAHNVFPLFNVTWRYVPTWEFRMQASRFSFVNVAHENFQWGPFFQWNSAMWTVHHNDRAEQLRISNCILGMGTTYNVKTASGCEMQWIADLGCSFYNSFRFRDKHGHQTLEKYHGNPGLYVRAGLQISF